MTTDLARLPSFSPDGAVHVVIEVPRGATAKFKYEPKLGCFVLSRSLALGVSYPFSWGFIPSTRAADGDPLDASVVGEIPTFPGLLLPCRPIGVLQVEQTEKRKTVRNDRVFLTPLATAEKRGPASVLDFSVATRSEYEQFFRSSIFGTEKKIKILGWKRAEEAMATIRKAAAQHDS